MKKLAIYFFLSLALLPLSSEYVSFNITSIFSLNNANLNSMQCSLKLKNAIVINMEEQINLLKALDIEVLQSVPNPISFSIYSLKELPKIGEKKYKAKEITSDILQQKKCSVLRFFYDEKNKSFNDATIKNLPYLLNEKTSPILIYFEGKAKPEKKDEDKIINIKLKPILHDIGGIKFNVIYPSQIAHFNIKVENTMEEKSNISIRVDDEYIKDFSKPLMLPSGKHKIQVDSHLYKSEVISCMIEKGKIENIDILLKSILPVLNIEGPPNTEVYLDDVPIKLPFSATVLQGEYLIKYKIDSYEVVRNIKIEEGKNYNINLVLEIRFMEN